MSDLQGRRALIMGMDSEAGYQKLSAKIPLKELASYGEEILLVGFLNVLEKVGQLLAEE